MGKSVLLAEIGRRLQFDVSRIVVFLRFAEFIREVKDTLTFHNYEMSLQQAITKVVSDSFCDNKSARKQIKLHLTLTSTKLGITLEMMLDPDKPWRRFRAT